MGRKKIAIRTIESQSNRRATFEKRRIGLLKKAIELSILTDSEVSLTIRRREEGSLQIYASDPYEEIIDKYQKYSGVYTLFTNEHLEQLIPGKMSATRAGKVGYHINKQSDINVAAKYEQITPQSQMEIIPTLPSPPRLSHLYSQMQNSHPSFNGYIQPYDFSGFTEPLPMPLPPPPNTQRRRSFSEMMGADMDQFRDFQPALKQFKIENHFKDVTNSSSISSETVSPYPDFSSFSSGPPSCDKSI